MSTNYKKPYTHYERELSDKGCCLSAEGESPKGAWSTGRGLGGGLTTNCQGAWKLGYDEGVYWVRTRGPPYYYSTPKTTN